MIEYIDNKIFVINNLSKSIKTPFYFPSISSIKANHDISEYLKVLKNVSYPGFLISAYDIFHHNNKLRLFKEINGIIDSNIFTLLDSGNYEAYWRSDKNWSFSNYETILKKVDVDLAFSFDERFRIKTKQNDYINEINKITAKVAASQGLGLTVPIIHLRKRDYKKVLKGVIEGINPSIIGIPERELGTSLLERAKSVKEIKKYINSLNRNIPIHLLGTGNPISMLIYTFCGADLFDALEWCLVAINPNSAEICHFSQLDLFDCNCAACKLQKIPYEIKVYAHNLIFFDKFTTKMREKIVHGNLEVMLKKYLPKHFLNKILTL